MHQPIFKLINAPNWLLLAVCFFTGAACSLVFAPVHWFYLAPFLLGGFFWLIDSAGSTRASFWRGYVFGLGFYLAGINWIYVSTGVYGEGGPIAGVLATIAFVAFLALFPATLSMFCYRFIPISSTLRYLVWFPAAWVAWEWIRSWILTGFPWLTMGYSQSDTLLGAFAPWFGVFAVSWLLAVLGGAVILLLFGGFRARLMGGCCALALLIVNMVASSVVWTSPIREPISVALVQGNIPQEKKWLPEQQMPTLRTYSGETENVWGADLIVWPETAISLFYHEVVADFIPALEEKSQEMGSDIITGIIQYDFEIGRYFNSIITIGSTHEFYAKKHLVPFGEYLPLRPVFGELLDILGAPLDDFKSGDPDNYILNAAGEPIGVSICYEDAFGNEIIRALPEATLLVNISNDGWFGDTWAPHQHVQMAQMRARETERFLLRSTNTGVSAIINHQGEIVARSPQYTVHTLTGSVQPRTGQTLFARVGNWPVVIAVLFSLLLVRRRKSSA